MNVKVDREEHPDLDDIYQKAAQDADSESEEGRFFVWEPGEIIAVLGQELGQVLSGPMARRAAGISRGKRS